ncbi:ribosomal L7Ae/L30e/S12e/Gadd45 family protein [Clostridium polynesiense]|uniref:ribosomal L7Ae/L30e/S12e/Gadd45 family protein n=1 Tax=Clostridium polynesiense TaxID=1325933 RepID=UPI00058E4784|nr:ribosomal L7Ae/L30e/S12e/Gadd45 family protein [Clostridium polynesiense]
MVDRLQGKKVVGIKQATKAIKSGKGDTLYVAKDADERVINPLIMVADEHEVTTIFVDTMRELGRLSGIDVGAAATLIIND